MKNSATQTSAQGAVDVCAELDRFRHRLLDLSNTNRLLNYRKSATRTIQIVDELPNQIFERLVFKDKFFAFLPSKDGTEEELPGADDGNANRLERCSRAKENKRYELPDIAEVDSVNTKRYTDDKLQTTLGEKRLERVLTKMRQEANAAIEETGVNHLFLALGMLDWREREGVERVFQAPLILVPLRMDRSFDARSNNYRTAIAYTGEDIQQNLCLKKRIETDFGIVLPDYAPDDDGSPLLPEAYFARIADAIATKPDWKIGREALIGFFSFRKLLMFLDLDPARWQGQNSPNNHPLVRAVVEGSRLDDVPEFYGKDYDIDEHQSAGQVTLVKDADSSQHSALCDIAEGRSLVIEGPPGTGKSQTITNAIANALGHGQSVLFVAEKVDALKVVHGNLEKVGLSNFCLALHSETANPRDVFADLGRRLDCEFTTPQGIQSLQTRIDAQKAKLKRYLLSCGLPAGPQSRPLYEVFWRIAELRSRNVKTLAGAKLDTSIDELRFDDSVACLKELAAYIQELGAPNESPWRGFTANRLPPTGNRDVEAIIGQFRTLAGDLLDGARVAQARFGSDERSWIVLAGTLADNALETLVAPPEFDRTLLPFLTSTEQCRTAVAAAKAAAEGCEALRRADELVVGDLQEARSAAQELDELIRKALPKSLRAISVSATRELHSQLTTALRALQALAALAAKLKALGFGEVQALRDYEVALYKYRLISHAAVLPPTSLFEPQFLAGAGAAFQRGHKTGTELESQKFGLEQYFYVPKCPDDGVLEQIIDRLEAYGPNWTKYLHAQYRQAKRRLGEFTRPAARKTRDREWVLMLTSLRQYLRAARDFLDDAELKRFLGTRFQGFETDWKALEVTLNWIHTAKKNGVGYQQAVDLITNRWNDELAPDPADLLAAAKELRRELAQSQVALALGLKPDAIEVTPLDKLQSFLVELNRRIDRLQVLSASFVVTDTTSLKHVESQARQVHEALGNAQQLQVRDEYCRAFPEHFRGVRTNSVALEATGQWLLSLHDLGLLEEAVRRIAADETGQDLQLLTTQIAQLRGGLRDWQERREELATFGTLDPSWLSMPGPAEDIVHIAALDILERDLLHLPPWAGLCRALDRCGPLGLSSFAKAVFDGAIRADQAVEAFDLTLHEQLAAEILQANEPLASFSRHAADQVRSEFQELDRQLIRANQQIVAHHASRRPVPLGISTGRVGVLTELGLIRHEVGKQRRYCRIRDLISRAGGAVQSLKPCFMMSPLSIAQYLPAGNLSFDLVVMDEASQIKPEDALGTLIRAKQIVVVGDPKQLPPTSFFDRISEADEEEDSTFLDDTESILEVSLKAFPHRRRLRWHYRSQHESLIAFSNEKFYDGDLVVFPSPTSAAGRLGLRWHAIENASFVGGCNPVEANTVAKAIIEHAKSHSSESLGVAAFNAKQAEAIRDRLDEITAHDSEARLALEQLLSGRDKLFVKNLESVQGDERDVIFISYTYGPDPATGAVMNRFGPMTGENGWRRLNVLVTRAKRRVEVFSSMTADQIKGGPDRSRGVNAMKDYLHYAMSGQLVDRGSRTGREPESPFELSVARVVESTGLKVVPQVGVAGYFIDLGVLKPDTASEFLLGIECDGATYHSSKSARDRDRLREEVITSRGWRLHRIWSTDWFLNQKAEEERLQAAIQRELSSG